MRPRRSVLYMPGSNSRALEKAKSLSADTLVFDLEDAVSPDQKVAARQQVIDAVRTGGYGLREIIIRANGLGTPWGEADITALSTLPIAGICLPKVESSATIEQAAALMTLAGADPAMAIWAMIETPRGVANAMAIAAAHSRLNVLVMGTTDLAKELRVPHTPERIGLIYALSQCTMAARVAGIEILDGVYLALDNPAGFAANCLQGRELGFDGKTLIHPSQVDGANAAFGPSAAELDFARKVQVVWDKAAAEGKAVAVVDGKLVEGMHVDEARRVLSMAELIDKLSQR